VTEVFVGEITRLLPLAFGDRLLAERRRFAF
jgi:hypothetical protein